MRKLVIFLSFTTAIFAASTIYLLAQRRSADAAPVAAGPVAAATAVQAGAVPVAGTSAPVTTPTVNEHPMTKSDFRLGDLDRRFLADAADPAARAKLIADTRSNLANEYQRLGHVVGLGNDEQDRLLSYLAEQQVASRESYLRCLADSKQEPTSCVVDLGPYDESIVALIGPEKQKRFEKYLTSMSERRLVTRLRGAMSDDQFMLDQQADDLVAALADENERRRLELGEALNGPDRITSDVPLLYTPGATRESLTAEAREHIDRLHARAAKVLRPAQLKAYDGMMEQRFGGVEYAIEAYLQNRAAANGH